MREVIVERETRGLHLLRATHDDHPATRGRKTTVDAIEQPSLELIFQRSDPPAERGLVHSQGLRCGPHGLMLSERQDVAQVVPIDPLGMHCPTSAGILPQVSPQQALHFCKLSLQTIELSKQKP